MKEIWKEIEGFEYYQVSNTGKIKSCKFNKEKELSQKIDKDGYHHVSIYGINCRKTFKVHRLVAQAFIQNTDNKPQINHKDGNKSNNNYWNLEWNTDKENINHAIKTKLRNNKGIKNCNHKLSEEQVLEIRRLYSSGNYIQSELAKMFNIYENHISLIINKKFWKHI